MQSHSKPHILIAGAGIGGLTLAQCLRARNHPFTIFDRDASAHSRPQGWTVALHTVLTDLVASIPDDMPSIEMADNTVPLNLPAQLAFYDVRNGAIPSIRFLVESKSASEVGLGEGRIIKANRDRLRDWYMTGIDVQWGKQAVGFEQDADGVTLYFADGTKATGDYLVGAEGSKSVIREGLAPTARLQKVPECFITGEVKLTKDQYERQLRLSHSSYILDGEGFHVFVGLNRIEKDANAAEFYWDLIWTDESRASGEHWIDTASSEQLYDFAVKMTADIDPRFTEIIRLTRPQDMMTPPLILRDLVLEDLPVSRVTLIGDAAHAMTPFKGEGGCHAIEDAMKLSKVLTEGGSLAEYQKEMLSRGSGASKASREAGNQVKETAIRKAWGQVVKPAPMNI